MPLVGRDWYNPVLPILACTVVIAITMTTRSYRSYPNAQVSSLYVIAEDSGNDIPTNACGTGRLSSGRGARQHYCSHTFYQRLCVGDAAASPMSLRRYSQNHAVPCIQLVNGSDERVKRRTRTNVANTNRCPQGRLGEEAAKAFTDEGCQL